MAFPVIAEITETSFASSATEHLVTMPATVDVGDLLLVFFANDGSATVALPTGWTLLDETLDGSNVRFSVYYKDAIGDEDSTTVDFVTSVDEQAAAQVYRITVASWHGTTAPEISTAVTGNDVNPDPADLNPSGWDTEDTLWIASYGADDEEDATAYPTNYTNGTYTESFAGSGSCGVGTARRELANASDNPPAFTINAIQQWVAFTVAIRPAAAGGSPDASGGSFIFRGKYLMFDDEVPFFLPVPTPPASTRRIFITSS